MAGETGSEQALAAFFAGWPLAQQLFAAIRREVDALGAAEIRVSKSQVAFQRKRNFALVWIPEQVLKRKAAPLVLTIGFRWRDESPRWKEITEPAPGRFTHHLELYSVADIDDEVRGWLRRAWDAADWPPGTRS